MKYKCKENDAIIEMAKNNEELLIYIKGERVKTVIGIKDLYKALEKFNKNKLSTSIHGTEIYNIWKMAQRYNCNDFYIMLMSVLINNNKK